MAERKRARRENPSSPINNDGPFLEHLPPELLTEIIARVAEESLAGLALLKQSSPSLKAAAEEQEVFRRSDLKPRQIEAMYNPHTTLTRPEKLHLMKCVAALSPFRQYAAAVKLFIVDSDIEGALLHLEKAVGSRSVIGPVNYLRLLGLIFSGSDEKINEGVEFLKLLKANGFFEKELGRCRSLAAQFLRDHNWRQLSLTWLNRERASLCPLRGYHQRRRIPDPWANVEGMDDCALCDVDREAEFIIRLH